MILEQLLIEKNILEIAILACFFFFGDWIYNIIISGVRRRIRSSVIGFIISLVFSVLIASVPILLVEFILTKDSSGWGWILSGVILVACFIKFVTHRGRD